MKFSKWHGLGNDFIIVDIETREDAYLQDKSKVWCDRHLGIGADGLVTLYRINHHEYVMRIYNSDGSEAEMCGNATRCVALHIKSQSAESDSRYTLHTRAGLIQVEVLDDQKVRVDMGAPQLTRGMIPVSGIETDSAIDISIELESSTWIGTAVSMGNPHVVIFVPHIEDVSIEQIGPRIETHALFPKKTNVEFVQVINDQQVRMRVWERGCGITNACGTGSCATVVAGVLTGRINDSATVILDGGELHVHYDRALNKVFMTGPAQYVFQGEIIER